MFWFYKAGIIGPNGKIGNGKKLNPKAAEKPKKPPVTRGKKYCVPKPEVNDQVLQANIDWACKNGVDCDPLVNMKEISCADQSLRTKAGYVMNYYYNANGRNESTCDFNHSAMLTLENPSKWEQQLQHQFINIHRHTIFIFIFCILFQFLLIYIFFLFLCVFEYRH